MRHEAVERRVGQHAGRVVRCVHDDEFRLRRQLPAKPLQVHLPTGIFAELVEGHIGAGRPRDLVEALVAGPGDDGVIAGFE